MLEKELRDFDHIHTKTAVVPMEVDTRPCLESLAVAHSSGGDTDSMFGSADPLPEREIFDAGTVAILYGICWSALRSCQSPAHWKGCRLLAAPRLCFRTVLIVYESQETPANGISAVRPIGFIGRWMRGKESVPLR